MSSQEFFKEYRTIGMDVVHRQVDKAATIREMIDLTYSGTEIVDVPWDGTNEHSHCCPEIISSDDEERTGALSESTRIIEASSDGKDSIGTKTVVPLSLRRMQTCPDWVNNLPCSLRGIYEEEKQRRDRNEPPPACSGTSHLRDVVVQMHDREGAIKKYLY
jgi:hypothetical protein